MRGVCMCTTGPPPGGRCSVCGIAGEPLYKPGGPVQPPREILVHGLTEARVREIVREELQYAIELLKRSGGGVGGDIAY